MARWTYGELGLLRQTAMTRTIIIARSRALSEIMVNINVSVVQAATAAFNLDDTLDKLDRLVRLAKTRDDSQLCVFPEAFIGELLSVLISSRKASGSDTQALSL